MLHKIVFWCLKIMFKINNSMVCLAIVTLCTSVYFKGLFFGITNSDDEVLGKYIQIKGSFIDE